MGTFLVKICHLKGPVIGLRGGVFSVQNFAGYPLPGGEYAYIKDHENRQGQSGFIMCFLGKNDFSNYHR